MFVPLSLSLLLSGCARVPWQPVTYQSKPAAVADPATEVKALLNMREYPAVLVEVTEQYVKESWAGGAGINTKVLPVASATFRIVTRRNIYQVSAYDAGGKEIWAYRPVMKDLPTCEKMMDALYALTKRKPQEEVPPAGSASQ
jgi:hypothetical protein